MTIRGLGVLAIAISGSGPVSATLAQALPASVRACASERDDARRLGCYDREIARLDQGGDVMAAPATKAEVAPAAAAAAATAPAAAATPPTAAAPAAAPDARFGYRGDIARKELDEQTATETVDRLEATITEVSSRAHGELVITLDNGQVWVQKAPDSKMQLKAGDQVTIKKASLGSYMLVAAGRSTRVTRVQ
jgi:hypothetical protein